MKLETLLKPIKYVDENVILRQYTKLGKKINIDEGKRKYWVAEGLWQIYAWTSFIGIESNQKLFGHSFNWGSYFALAWKDAFYNSAGLWGLFKEEDKTSDSIAIDPKKEKYRKYNSYVRLPTFLFGVGLVGKFGIDAVNSIKNKTPLEPTSWYCLVDGLGHLSLASSMYIKETDPKLLDKAPLWKKALQYVKEKVDSISPMPNPVPVPAVNYQTIENQ
jgi:hypothetical protein